ncbi:MAG: M1 family aminopeptidase [Bdellovibrionia bacterium]
MREKMICRFCETQKTSFQAVRGSERRSFAIAGSDVHYAPDRPFRLEHIFLDLVADPKTKTLRGSAIQTVRVISPGQKWLRLDQVNLKIDEVFAKIIDETKQVKSGNSGKLGKKADFFIEGTTLRIDLGEPKADQLYEIVIHYQVDHPRRGMYFTGPDEAYPQKPYQMWTQGQDEDSRYWFPTLDYPNQKATSEIRVVVPEGFTAVSNGALLSKKKINQGLLGRDLAHILSGASVEFHYRLGSPHVTYLISLVIAEFSEWSELGPRGLPVQYFVAKGREADGKRAFGNTARMIEVFENKTGIEFPFEKYSQVAVQDFIFGGMENTSATTQTDLVLHDEKAHLDFSADPLVSHELAHQWFGDLVTCRDWSHGWLNEGFATFMERVWVECRPSLKGETGQGSYNGIEEGKYYAFQDFREYLSEDQNSYRRPIVCNTYIEPIDLFDTHLYQKGGLVLNLIRYVLGDDLFWKSIQLYLTRHRDQSVETIDLIRAIEDATGKNLRRLFDEWVFGAGYPEFELTYSWHEEKKQTEWVIEQKQTEGAPSITKEGATTHLFHLPVILEMTLAGGEVITHRLEIQEARERVFLPASSKPLMVRFDPGHAIPKSLKFPRPKEMLLYQLIYDKDCMGRIEAAHELVQNDKTSGLEVTQALGKALLVDSFWGVQVEIASVLAELRTAEARSVLIQSLKVNHPKARRAVVQALGTYHHSSAAEALRALAEKDESYYVEAESTYAWSMAQLELGYVTQEKKVSEVEKFLLRQMEKPSYRDVIRNFSLNALSELPGIGSGERANALQTVIHWTQRGQSIDARSAAVRALGKVLLKARSSEKAKILGVFEQLSDEDHFRLRIQLVHSLADSECVEAVPILQKIFKLDTDGRVKRNARSAIDRLLTSGGVPSSVANLKTALQKLEEDYRSLRTKFEQKS